MQLHLNVFIFMISTDIEYNLWIYTNNLLPGHQNNNHYDLGTKINDQCLVNNDQYLVNNDQW